MSEEQPATTGSTMVTVNANIAPIVEDDTVALTVLLGERQPGMIFSVSPNEEDTGIVVDLQTGGLPAEEVVSVLRWTLEALEKEFDE